MATGDLEHDAARTGARPEAFWEVLERVAALGGDGARLRRPIPFEVVPDGAQDADAPRMPQGPVPQEVYQRLRSLLSDVDTLGDALVGGGGEGSEPEPSPPEAEGPSAIAPSEEEDAQPGDARDPVVTPADEETSELDGGREQVSAPARPVWLAWQDVPEEPDGAVASDLASADAPVGEQAPADGAATSRQDDGAGHGIGAHSSVIPGTEEFMALLERKNRAFEETGEIDTDLDRAADRLAWDRATDDVIAKRRLFRKRKRD